MTKRNLTLAIALVALALTAAPAFAGTLTGAPPLSGAGPTVTLNVPSRVGAAWNHDILFDLNAGTQVGSCLSYPPAPTATTPCYWGDDGAGGPTNAFQFFANTTGASNKLHVTIVGADAAAIGSSNATIGNVFYAVSTANGGAPCSAGDATAACVTKGYLQMSGTAATLLVPDVTLTATGTSGWTSAATAANILRFIFQVPANLTPTTGAQSKATTINLTIP
jgi:hypothetical protein